MAEVRRGAKINPDGLELNERVVQVNRVAKVVKGGRRFSFSALVVVGNEVDTVGVGHGKAKEVPVAIQKAVEDAKKNLFRVPKYRTTITHQVLGRSGAGKVFMKPASEGTGVIAGGGVRAVLELAGIRDILTKSLGTSNPVNLVAATVAGLKDLRRPEEVAALRDKTVAEVLSASRPARALPPPSPSAAAAPAVPNDPPRDHPGAVADRDPAAPPRHAPRARPRPHRPDRRARGLPQLQGMLRMVARLVRVENASNG